jgi:hypothetical protein
MRARSPAGRWASCSRSPAGDTYEMFAPCWGAMDPGSHPIADALTRRGQYSFLIVK